VIALFGNKFGRNQVASGGATLGAGITFAIGRVDWRGE